MLTFRFALLISLLTLIYFVQTSTGSINSAATLPPKYATTQQLQNFRHEIAALESLGKHENIIG